MGRKLLGATEANQGGAFENSGAGHKGVQDDSQFSREFDKKLLAIVIF